MKRSTIGGRAAPDHRLDPRHHLLGIGISQIDDVTPLREVERRYVDRALYHQRPIFGHVVVGGHRGQRHGLIYYGYILVYGFVVLAAACAQNYVGVEGSVERAPREVVVQTSVAEYHRVDLDRREDHRYGHRRAHGECQIARFELDGAVAVDVGGHAAEGHHELIEVAAAGDARRLEELQQRHVYLRGVYHRARYVEALASRVELHVAVGRQHDVEHAVHAVAVAIVVVILVVDAPRDPLLGLSREHDVLHFVGRVSRSVECCHYGSDRCSRDAVDRDSVLFQRAYHADMIQSLRSAAAQYQTDALRAGDARSEERKDHKRDENSSHIIFF